MNQTNAANPQHAVRIANAGVAHAVSIFHNPAAGGGDSTAEALDVVSTNPLDTTVGVRGQEEGRGTVKITHEKPANPDAERRCPVARAGRRRDRLPRASSSATTSATSRPGTC